jgi:hypothetical protein
MKMQMVAQVVVRAVLPEETVALLEVGVEHNQPAGHLFLLLVQHYKAALSDQKATEAAEAAVAAGIGAVVAGQTQTPVLQAVAVLATSTHLL